MAAQTVAYYVKTSYGGWSRAKIQNQDDTYGVAGKAIRVPHTLGMLDENGKLIILSELLNKMKTPVWGADKNQLFADLIPNFPAKVPSTLPSPQWESFPFDPNNPETYPKTECPPKSQYYPAYDGPRGWECQPENHPNTHYQNMHWYGVEESLPIWTILKIVSYRQQKDDFDHPVIPNPEYPIVEAQRAVSGEVYSNLLRSTFFPVASYQFQGLPLNGNGVEYQWSIDGVKTPPIPGHKLAIALPTATSSTWTFIPERMRNPEIISVNTSGGVIIRDLHESVYVIKTQPTTWDVTKELKMAYLTK